MVSLFSCPDLIYTQVYNGVLEGEETLILIPILFLASKKAWGKLLHLCEIQFLLGFEVHIVCCGHFIGGSEDQVRGEY
jgi:hypothetical protein